jgi:hypothetical protein
MDVLPENEAKNELVQIARLVVDRDY